jgi:hypothetical protein
MTTATKRANKKGSKQVRSTISKARRLKAISMLRRWAHDNVGVHYVDTSSGLRHPGVLVDITDEDDGVPMFEFSGLGGVTATIHPFGWANLDVQAVPTSESIHVEERFGGRFGIAPIYVPRTRETELKCAKVQLDLWRTQRTLLHCFLSQDSLSFSFGGKIANASSAGFAVEVPGTNSLICLTFSRLTCRISAKPDTTLTVCNRQTGTHLVMSEIQLPPADVLKLMMN